MDMTMDARGLAVTFRVQPPVSHEELNALFDISWPHHTNIDFEPVLSRSLLYLCAYAADRLIGFVNVAWDGGIHAFLLDTTVDPAYRRRGVGHQLVARAAVAARDAEIRWLHVDFEPHLREFYAGCGFRLTEAGLLELNSVNGDFEPREP